MTNKARYFIIENDVSLSGGNEGQPSKILSQISDKEIDKLYDMIGDFDGARNQFKGTKREYVLAVYKLIAGFMTAQVMVTPNLLPSKKHKSIRKTHMEGGIKFYVTSTVEALKQREEDLNNKTTDELEVIKEVNRGNYNVERVKDDESAESYDAWYNMTAADNILKRRKSPAAVADEGEEKGEGETPSEKIASAFYKAYEKTTKRLFSDDKDKRKLIQSLSNAVMTKEQYDTLLSLTDEDFARQMREYSQEVVTTVRQMNRKSEVKAGKPTFVPDYTSPVSQVLSGHINSIVDKIKFIDVVTMVKTFEPYAEGLLSGIKDKTITQNQSNRYYGRNLLNFTVYPKLTDFSTFNGDESLCRRFIFKGQGKKSGEQGKIGEFKVRALTQWMTKFGFISDQYNLSEIATRQQLLESDILDLQEFKDLGNGKTELRVGEIKTFTPGDVEFQYTKLLFFVHMRNEYDKLDTARTIGEVYRPKIMLDGKPYYFPIEFKESDYPYVPFVVNIFNPKSYIRKNVDSVDAMPVMITYDALKMADKMKSITRKTKPSETMFNKILEDTPAESYFTINSKGRIVKKSTAPSSVFSRIVKSNYNIPEGVNFDDTDCTMKYTLLNKEANGYKKSFEYYKKQDGTTSTTFNAISMSSFILTGGSTDRIFTDYNMRSYEQLTPKEERDLNTIPEFMIVEPSEKIEESTFKSTGEVSNVYETEPAKLLQTYNNILKKAGGKESKMSLNSIKTKWTEYVTGLSDKVKKEGVRIRPEDAYIKFFRDKVFRKDNTATIKKLNPSTGRHTFPLLSEEEFEKGIKQYKADQAAEEAKLTVQPPRTEEDPLSKYVDEIDDKLERIKSYAEKEINPTLDATLGKIIKDKASGGSIMAYIMDVSRLWGTYGADIERVESADDTPVSSADDTPVSSAVVPARRMVLPPPAAAPAPGSSRREGVYEIGTSSDPTVNPKQTPSKPTPSKQTPSKLTPSEPFVPLAVDPMLADVFSRAFISPTPLPRSERAILQKPKTVQAPPPPPPDSD